MWVFSVCQAAVYSSVNKTHCEDAAREEDREPDYSSIGEIKGLVTTSSSSDLYATVRDVCPQTPELGDEAVPDSCDPGYETIRIPKTSSSEAGEEGSEAAAAEPDYESVGEVGLSRDVSRL